MSQESSSQDGLKKKYADMLAQHEEVASNLALFQQRCKDLETERMTYLASHAALVRSQSPSLFASPSVSRPLDLRGLVVAVVVQIVLLGAVLVTLLVK